MKLSASTFALLLFSASAVTAFQASAPRSVAPVAPLAMFSGAGAGAPKEDDEDQKKQMEAAAKAMGMSLDEYQAAMNARAKLTQALDEGRVSGGSNDKVLVSRDLNSPPKTFDIVVTDAGKELGPEALSKELVRAVKSASEASKKGRQDAQRKMMEYITTQIKN